ncbi:G-protein coupled receptor 26 isoform X2 [Struthio camelus]|uniref:G-protein coupled receptor 26 isoform X2 n=1 Tax=Struthio camelus TaxID=8801 RepID=UPI00051E2275|nr:PREDICTED: G-protein coupled receptor 26 isoform X2 [Struthio camelus australis]
MNIWEVTLAFVVVVLILVSLLSNVLVLICFLYSADIRKQVPGLFILNLTLCNLLMTVSNMPLTLAGIIYKSQPGGDQVCHTVGFLETFLTTNSMLSMAALSIDRWIAVVFPLSYHSKMRYRDAALILSYTWLHSVSFPIVAASLSWVGFHHLYASCTLYNKRPEDRTQFVIFTGVFHTLSFLLSLIILCFTYLKVLKVARFHCKRIDVITMQTLVLLVDIHPSVRERCLEEQRRRRQRATKKISTFIGTFILCFAPYVITRPMPPTVRQWPRIRVFKSLSSFISEAIESRYLQSQTTPLGGSGLCSSGRSRQHPSLRLPAVSPTLLFAL